ncbi:MAG: ABC transporter ATP-binding protein [Desulfobacterales bacterium]|nr:ABC transporter ATP-binding protein [Desulfobacterales bacterium]MBS3756149.1 ABC transporter ATP-binding protein [Desulfobacterales bacterium]
MTGILETRDLCHDFNGLKVLTHIQFSVQPGERHAIIGPNGAGKTTFFNLVTGVYTPASGRILFKDVDVTKAKPYRLTRMGLGRSFQITSIFQRQTPFQNIRLAILSKNRIRFNLFVRVDRMNAINEQTNEILQEIQLADEAHLPTSTLSYGKQRSLDLGMALATAPDLLLFDEPTAGMSRDESHSAVELIRKLTEGKTMVIVEHDMDVVFSLADRITVLHRGEILATGTPYEIQENDAVKKAYLGESEV